METDNEIRRGIPPFFVLILPMRNGNESYLNITEKLLIVLILPMRNGNKSSPSNTREASSYVLILPMRNGNLHTDV